MNSGDKLRNYQYYEDQAKNLCQNLENLNIGYTEIKKSNLQSQNHESENLHQETDEQQFKGQLTRQSGKDTHQTFEYSN